MEFYIFFILISFSFEFIIIPFSSELSNIEKDLQPSSFIYALTNNELYSNINIGTPNQTLKVCINFKSFHTYILQKQTIKKKFVEYNESSSSSYKLLYNKTIYCQDCEFNYAYYSSDKISIGENLKDNYINFMLVVKESSTTRPNFAGSLGFGVVNYDGPQDTGIVYYFKNKTIIDNYFIKIVFNKNNFDGKIIIGENIYEKYNKDYFQSQNILIDYEYHLFWGWNFLNLSYNDNQLYFKFVYVKPELGVIVAPKELKELVKKNFFDEKIKEKKCYESLTFYYFYYCNQDVEIDIGNFHFFNKNAFFSFELNSNDLIYNYNGKKFFLIVFQEIMLDNNIYLGYPFLKKYDVILEQDKRIAGFYNFPIDDKEEEKGKKKDENKEEEFIKNIDKKSNNTKYIVLLLFLIVIIILYFVFLQFRKIKRKKKFVSMDFEYSEIN
jgi:hypothetical protein